MALLRRRRAPDPAPSEPPDREGVDNRNLELLLGFLLREDDDCIDVGANEGRFLWHITRRAPRGRHIAVEPIPELAAQVARSFPDVQVHQCALSDAEGEAEFVQVLDDSGYSGLRERQYPAEFETRRIQVPVRRLDDLVAPDASPAFIKIDVEGGELGVLRGGMETLRRCRPVVVFEHGMGAADRYDTTPEQVWDVLAGDIGLRIFDLDARGPLGRDEFAELYGSGTRWNWVARP